jgi:hypothetical protein
MESNELFIQNIVAPKFAAVGGIKQLVKYYERLKVILPMLYNSELSESETINRLQNLLTAEGMQKDTLELLNLFDKDSIDLTIRRFELEKKEVYTDLKFKSSLTFSDFDKLDLDLHKSWYTKDGLKRGFLVFLPNLPKLEDNSMIDLGL